jgi:hypothetical protein
MSSGIIFFSMEAMIKLQSTTRIELEPICRKTIEFKENIESAPDTLSMSFNTLAERISGLSSFWF